MTTQGSTHSVGFARCTCGWTCTRPTEGEASAAAQVHAIGHRTRGQRVDLPLRPIAGRIGAWSPEAA
jgi:hypothetical protein